MTKLEAQEILVEYVDKRKGKRVMALEEVSFSVQEGQFVAIVGPSGCGKSTLLNVIGGLQPFQGGRLLLDGQDLTGPGSDRAMVFQSPSLMPWRTVMGNVTYGLELQGYRPDQIQLLGQQYIDLVGLSGFEESYPHTLSGGMRQRANLARALAVEPTLLLLDEPLSALDAQTRAYMQWELQRIWLQTKSTAVYVTHQISEAIYLADQVIVMSARPGKITETILIDFPRPRSLAIQQDPKFAVIEQHIWSLLQAEAVKMGMMIHEGSSFDS